MEALEWTTFDKSDWGDGPWQHEPDKAQWADDATGLPCLLKRGPHGNLCGYVGVPAGHPWYGADFMDLDVDVHGGLTYASQCDPHEDPAEGICHTVEPGEDDDVWWLGFDCMHSFDLVPAMAARERKRFEETGDPTWAPVISDATYRTVGYVRCEVASLAAQVTEAA